MYIRVVIARSFEATNKSFPQVLMFVIWIFNFQTDADTNTKWYRFVWFIS